jgi:hypothetical protein
MFSIILSDLCLVADAYAKYTASFKLYFWLQEREIVRAVDCAPVAEYTHLYKDCGVTFMNRDDFTLTFKFVGVDDIPYPNVLVVVEEFDDFAFRVSSLDDFIDSLKDFREDCIRHWLAEWNEELDEEERIAEQRHKYAQRRHVSSI